MKLHCATTNPGKLREFQQAASHFGAGIKIESVAGLRLLPAPAETGSTFRDNAILKAEYYSRHCQGLLFADDSGLSVDALEGAPGVYSARYAGEYAGDKANNERLIASMRGKTQRSARFICVIALARDGELIQTFDGLVEGEILEQERGGLGFGYDPLFFFPPYGCTLAEMDESRKMSVSHRGAAIEKMLRYLAGPGRAA